ncbi:hypothetical protein AA313_de0209241 [Arthrobotrys entomopaga]|nr:hypothetical protein AA313_de0209241 [Arthrobotrys entomopaga]
MYFIGAVFSVPTSRDTDIESPNGRRGLTDGSGYLGGNKKQEDQIKKDGIILFLVFLKKRYWDDVDKLMEVESEFRKILEPDDFSDSSSSSSSDEDPGEGLWYPNYKDVGTPYVLIRGKYKSIGSVIVHESIPTAPEITQYLSAWQIVYTEKALEDRIEEDDAQRYLIDPTSQRRKRGLQKNALQELNETHSELLLNRIENSTKGDIQTRAKVLFEKPFFPDFRFYSKPPESELVTYQMYYEDSQGENIDIFVLDTGFADYANDLKGFKNAFANGQIKGWIVPGGPLASKKEHESSTVGEAPDDADPNKTVHTHQRAFHGTRVISKIIDDKAGAGQSTDGQTGQQNVADRLTT